MSHHRAPVPIAISTAAFQQTRVQVVGLIDGQRLDDTSITYLAQWRGLEFRLHCTHDLRECRPWSFRIRRVGMDEAIARENIKHFRKLLETEADEAKRETIMQLLTEEEVKLAMATNRKKRR